jgi:manganese transport protein
MIDTLSNMYVPAFGDWTKTAFLVGVWAVLFKTLYVASASHSRLCADFLSLTRLVRYDEAGARQRVIRRFCMFFPTLALVLYFWQRDPKLMVIIGGFCQAATLPIISGAAIFLRYRRLDPRLRPSRLFDVCVWVAFLSITAVAIYALQSWGKQHLLPLLEAWWSPADASS